MKNIYEGCVALSFTGVDVSIKLLYDMIPQDEISEEENKIFYIVCNPLRSMVVNEIVNEVNTTYSNFVLMVKFVSWLDCDNWLLTDGKRIVFHNLSDI